MSKELEELQNKKTGLEEESRNLEEQQKNLTERVKALEEKVTIQGLEDGNQTKQKAIHELESKIDELEKKLRKTPWETTPFTPTEEPTLEASEPISEEPMESDVTVSPVDEPAASPQFENVEDDINRQHEKKKRRLF